MLKHKIKLIIPLTLSISLMVIIFLFSSQNGEVSSVSSQRVSRLFARIIFFDFNNMQLQQQNMIINGLNGFIRKLAHFSIYMLLGFNVLITVKFFIKKLYMQILTTIIICIAYASFDEFHQLHSSGRSGNITDVILDTCGSLCGILAAIIFLSILFYFRYNKLHDD